MRNDGPFTPEFAGMATLYRFLTSPEAPRLLDAVAGMATGYLRSYELIISRSIDGRGRARLRRMHTRYPHRRRPR